VPQQELSRSWVFENEKIDKGSSRLGTVEANPTTIREDAGSIPGLSGLGIPHGCGCGVGRQLQL